MTPVSLAERVPHIIREAMRAAGVSQARLAGKLGISQQALSRRLTGDVPFSIAELDAVDAALGTTTLRTDPAALTGASDVVGVEPQTLPTTPEGPVADSAGSSTHGERAS